METILYDIPVFSKFSSAEKVEALKYLRVRLQESKAVPINAFDRQVISIRKRLEQTAGRKFVSRNEKLVQDLCNILNKA